MKTGIIMASIVAGAILIAAAAMIYFSPFQTCVRATTGLLPYANGPAYSVREAQELCAARRISN
jgi:hypothetical protein